MSNLSDAIEHLEDAHELVDTEAEIDDLRRPTLLNIVAQIHTCKTDLEDLVEDEEG